MNGLPAQKKWGITIDKADKKERGKLEKGLLHGGTYRGNPQEIQKEGDQKEVPRSQIHIYRFTDRKNLVGLGTEEMERLTPQEDSRLGLRR